MGVKAFRVKNFMGFEDSGWIELRPLTLLFGRNNTGKSALLRALLLLKQSLRLQVKDGPFLMSSEQGVDLGSFKNTLHNHDLESTMSFGFQCKVDLKSLQ